MTTKPTQTAQPANLPVEKVILIALRKKEHNRGELADLTGQPYSLLVPVLNALLNRGLIESYFQTKESLPILTYRLRSPNVPPGKILPPPPPPLNPRLRQ